MENTKEVNFKNQRINDECDVLKQDIKSLKVKRDVIEKELSSKQARFNALKSNKKYSLNNIFIGREMGDIMNGYRYSLIVKMDNNNMTRVADGKIFTKDDEVYYLQDANFTPCKKTKEFEKPVSIATLVKTNGILASEYVGGDEDYIARQSDILGKWFCENFGEGSAFDTMDKTFAELKTFDSNMSAFTNYANLDIEWGFKTAFKKH